MLEIQRKVYIFVTVYADNLSMLTKYNFDVLQGILFVIF